MSTTADFVGMNCPHCGAVDSLHTDDALGEVACTECALVVAMGLEENLLTRFNKDATYDDADTHCEHEAKGSISAGDKNVLSFSEIQFSSSLNLSNAAKDALAKVKLYPSMLNCIWGLQKKSGVSEMVGQHAVNIAKMFICSRRARGQRVEKCQDIAAACFMIAAEKANHPIPLSELRNLDTTLGDVTHRRADVVKEIRMEEEEARLKSVFVDNLLATYLRKLGLQLSLYTPHCKRLFGALQHIEGVSNVIVAEKVVMAVLLSQTVPSFQCEGEPIATTVFGGKQGNSASGVVNESCTETIYANFAAKAHLDLSKIKKLMQLAISKQQKILEILNEMASVTNGANKEGDCDNDKSNNLAPVAKRIKTEND